MLLKLVAFDILNLACDLANHGNINFLSTLIYHLSPGRESPRAGMASTGNSPVQPAFSRVPRKGGMQGVEYPKWER